MFWLSYHAHGRTYCLAFLKLGMTSEMWVEGYLYVEDVRTKCRFCFALFLFAKITSDVSDFIVLGYFLSRGPGVRTTHSRVPKWPTVNMRHNWEIKLRCFQSLKVWDYMLLQYSLAHPNWYRDFIFICNVLFLLLTFKV